MIPELQQALSPRQYDELPEGIKTTLSPREWLWLSDGEKARLVQTETEPDTYDE